MIWETIRSRRLSVADLLDDLTAAEWDQPSLCAGWTVRDVAAHLTLQQMGLREAVTTMIRWRGSMDRTTQEAARRRAAALSPARIAAEIRETAPNRRHNIGVTPLETLIDLLVHEQDMAIPLGRRRAMPPEAAAVAATRLLSMRFPPPLPSVRRMAGVRLTATDMAWSHGDGPQASGPMSALLLVCAGRTAALTELTGPGAAVLTERLSPAAT